MSNDWWARKLGTVQQQPAGIPVAPRPQPVQQPQHQYVQQPQPTMAEYNEAADPNRRLSLREAVVRFKGAEGMRTEGHMNCPNCGSKSGFTAFSGMNAAGAGVVGSKPAPHCFECGYNGKFAQGMESSWA